MEKEWNQIAYSTDRGKDLRVCTGILTKEQHKHKAFPLSDAVCVPVRKEVRRGHDSLF